MATGSESQNNLVPCFIKIVPEDIDNQKSGIMPPSFKKIIGKEYPRSIGLRGPSIRTMRMIVDKEGDEIVLWWKNFLDTNRIRPSNFVLFRYLGNMYFNVQVFDASGVERLHKPWPENHQEVVGTSNEKKKRRPKQCEQNDCGKKEAREENKMKGNIMEVKIGRGLRRSKRIVEKNLQG